MNDAFGTIRTLSIDGNPWFVGKDVAIALGYSNASKAIIDHVDAEDKRFEMFEVSDSQNGNLVKTAIISESGLYSLILSSKLPSAKEFKRWVTSEVLPSIRKHGVYTTDDLLNRTLEDPDFMIDLLQQLKAERQARKQQQEMLKAYEPKVAYYNKILSSNDTMNISQIAADYGISAKKLNKLLAKEGVQWKNNGQWLLKERYKNQGYTDSATYTFEHSERIEDF